MKKKKKAAQKRKMLKMLFHNMHWGRIQLCYFQVPWSSAFSGRYLFIWNSRESTPDTDSFMRGFWITRLSGNFCVQINM